MTDQFAHVEVHVAESVVEQLRYGIPPKGFLRDFTVGRLNELEELEITLRHGCGQRGRSRLVQANYGAGKTHLLQLIRELALEAGYAVALVTVDAKAGVRFNRMDQVMGAVMRSVEVPKSSAKGVAALFDAYFGVEEHRLPASLLAERAAVSSNGRWDRSDALGSDGLWVAMRAWHLSTREQSRHMAVDWLANSWNYTVRGDLYRELVARLPAYVRDPRPQRSFFARGVFDMRAADYAQSWAALEGLQRLAVMSGLCGLVILFDEFEDVIQNLRRIDLERDAFDNLFSLFDGHRFSGSSYFAVTPEFSAKCRRRLTEKFVYDFPVDRFDELPCFELAEIQHADVVDLLRRVREIHGIAYEWDSAARFSDDVLVGAAEQFVQSRGADEVRQVLTGFVKALDTCVD